jgi:DNA gyrase/topoisomerase IV subunit A
VLAALGADENEKHKTKCRLAGVEKTVEALRRELIELHAQQSVTLELLGEREEELEATKSELEEVKEMFRVQIDALIKQTVVSPNTASIST